MSDPVPNPITELTPQQIQNFSFDSEFGVLVAEMIGFDGTNPVRVQVDAQGVIQTT